MSAEAYLFLAWALDLVQAAAGLIVVLVIAVVFALLVREALADERAAVEAPLPGRAGREPSWIDKWEASRTLEAARARAATLPRGEDR